MTAQNKSVWFYEDNKEYVQEQADKDNVSFNKKMNEIISKERTEKKEV